MIEKRKRDAETTKLWHRLGQSDFAYPDYRKSLIVSAYYNYRKEFGSVLISTASLRVYLRSLFENKGSAQGYAVAVNLRDAFRALWGGEASAQVIRLVRDIQPRIATKLMSEWDQARTPISRLPMVWQDPFMKHLANCKDGSLPPLRQQSASSLKGNAEALCQWLAFRNEKTSGLLTGSELRAFAAHLSTKGVAPAAVWAGAQKVYSSYQHVLTPGFSSESCQYVLQDLKGRAKIAGATRKTAGQIVSAQLIYTAGFRIMENEMSNPRYDMASAKVYRDGLLLAVAAALPLRRRTLASLDTASSFILGRNSDIQIDISGNFLKLREHRKIIERFRATLVNPRLWRAVDIWTRKIRPIFDDGTSLFPSARVRGEALVPDILSQIFGDVTKDQFGIRIPIHRVRDCVATECVEEMENGAAWAPYLLHHKSADTTNKYYVHATGVKATKEFGRLVQQKRSDPTNLLI